MTTTNNAAANTNTARPAVSYNCAFCGAFNNRGCFCGCAASRVAHNERIITTVAKLDAIELVF